MEDLTGKQLGQYRIEGPLGEGGMAAVYRAYQSRMDRYVALKVLPRYFATDPRFVSRFNQEAKIVAQLQHPHILPVYDFGEDDGFTYIVMPFIQDGTLGQWMQQQRLTLSDQLRCIMQVGDALDYAHSRGVLHRDVKPSNVLLDERSNSLLTDFGIAKILEASTYLTQSGSILGTPTYMSPEQGQGQPLDQRSDIYSLGVMLYHIITGRPPFQANTPMAVLVKHIHDPLPAPSRFNSAISPDLEHVIFTALAKDPDDRYATASDFIQALRQLEGPAPAFTQPMSPPPGINQSKLASEPPRDSSSDVTQAVSPVAPTSHRSSRSHRHPLEHPNEPLEATAHSRYRPSDSEVARSGPLLPWKVTGILAALIGILVSALTLFTPANDPLNPTISANDIPSPVPVATADPDPAALSPLPTATVPPQQASAPLPPSPLTSTPVPPPSTPLPVEPPVQTQQPNPEPFEPSPPPETLNGALATNRVQSFYTAVSAKDWATAEAFFGPELANQFDPEFFGQFERVTVENLRVINQTDSLISLEGENTYYYPDGSIQREERTFTFKFVDGDPKIVESNFVRVLQFRN